MSLAVNRIYGLDFKVQKRPLGILKPASFSRSLGNNQFVLGANNNLLAFRGSKRDSLSYEEFNKRRIQAGLLDEEDFKKQIKPENLLGTGLHSEVYEFSDVALDRWVLKVDKKPAGQKPEAGLLKVQNEFGSLNMGQEIASIGDRYHILKKIKGNPHSLNDWSAHINNNSVVSKDEAMDFLDSIEKISKFDNKTFEDYAKQLKTISDKGYKMDSINPNNLLIDYDNQEIHIIDFFKVADPSHIDTGADLINCLLDFSFFDRFYKELDNNEKTRLIEARKTISAKCIAAANKNSVLIDEAAYIDYLANVDKYFGCHLVDKGGDYRARYERFKELLHCE